MIGEDLGAASAISVRGLVKRFGEVAALDAVDLEVPSGSVMALLGANGAGKTTLVRILTTLVVPDAGQAVVGGWDVAEHGDRVRPLLGATGQYAAVDDRLTARENLDLIARLYHLPSSERRRRTGDLLERLALTDDADRRVGTFSGGMRRRLDIAAGIVGGTPVLILDEPTTGLDPRTRNAVWEVIRGRAAEGTTVLLTTQYLEESDQLADRIALLERGTVAAEGSPDEVKDLVSSSVLDVRIGTAPLDGAAAALAGLGYGEPQVDPVQRRLTVLDVAPPDLPRVLERLAEKHVDLVEVGVRRPTLDEVFLALTGPGRGRPPTPAGSPLPISRRPDRAEPMKSTAAAPPTRRAISQGRQGSPRRRVAGDIAALVVRNLRRLSRDPQTLALSLGQPILLLLGFRYLLGGAIAVPGGDYVQYLLPGLFTASVIIASGGTAISLAQDLQRGIIDRFRTLPIARSAVLAARTLSDQVVNLAALGAIVALAVPLGFEFEGSASDVLLALALLALLGYALTWMYAAIGSALGSPEAAYAAGTIALFLLLFASSAFAPVEAMPDWLRPIAGAQPVTITIDTVRALTNGEPAGTGPWQSALWSMAILVPSLAFAVSRYRRLAG